MKKSFSFFPGRMTVSFRKGPSGHLRQDPSDEAMRIKKNPSLQDKSPPQRHDLVRTNALTAVLQRGGDVSDRQEVEEKERAGTFNPQGNSKDSLLSFLDYARSFQEIEDLREYLLSRKPAPPVSSEGDNVVGFGARAKHTWRQIWESREDGYAAFIVGVKCVKNSKMYNLQQYLLQQQRAEACPPPAEVSSTSAASTHTSRSLVMEEDEELERAMLNLPPSEFDIEFTTVKTPLPVPPQLLAIAPQLGIEEQTPSVFRQTHEKPVSHSSSSGPGITAAPYLPEDSSLQNIAPVEAQIDTVLDEASPCPAPPVPLDAPLQPAASVPGHDQDVAQWNCSQQQKIWMKTEMEALGLWPGSRPCSAEVSKSQQPLIPASATDLPGVAPLPIASSPWAARTGPIKTGGLTQVLDHSQWTGSMRSAIDGLLYKHHGAKDILKRVDADYAAMEESVSRATVEKIVEDILGKQQQQQEQQEQQKQQKEKKTRNCLACGQPKSRYLGDDSSIHFSYQSKTVKYFYCSTKVFNTYAAEGLTDPRMSFQDFAASPFFERELEAAKQRSAEWRKVAEERAKRKSEVQLPKGRLCRFCHRPLKQGPDSPHIHTSFPGVPGKYIYCPSRVFSLYKEQGMVRKMSWRDFQQSAFFMAERDRWVAEKRK
ncbi:hypothetical protein ABVT39_013076 [Epinephelus coioides]